MSAKTSFQFPCPFCRCERVVQTNGGGRFIHYRCVACAEVWTGMNASSEPALVGSASAGSPRPVSDTLAPRKH